MSVVAAFIYRDEHGKPLARLDRVEPGFHGRRKEFLPYAADDHGGFAPSPGLGGRKLPLYRADEVTTAVRERQGIFLVEGEGKADCLRDALRIKGSRAAVTTIQGGASAPIREKHLAALEGATWIVIVVDSDEAGRKSGFNRASAIRERYPDLSVKIVDLYRDRNDGPDIADWLAEGHSLGNLRSLVDAAAELPAANASSSVEWDESHAWPALDPLAYHGLAGEVVRELEPHTEADPAALLFALLAMVGNMAGKTNRAQIHDDEHPARLFVAIVGATSKGAKGTGDAALRPLIRAADPDWFATRVRGGFGSGEAIVKELEPKGEGQFDPRLLIREPEFARLLAINGREASTASMIVRQAWDGYPLERRLANEKSLMVRDHHVSMLAHITPEELLARLTETDMANGFANRFLFVASQRSKLLPFGGNVAPEVIDRLGQRLRGAIARARQSEHVISFDEDARGVWDAIYRAEPDRAGLVAALTARAHAQKLRLAVAYAVLDGADAIKAVHVVAAEACWRYSVATVEHIFSDLRGDGVQDRLLQALREAYPAGLTGTDQAALFGRNLKVGRLASARRVLEHDGMIRTEHHASGEHGGRPEVVSRAIPRAGNATKKHESTSLERFFRVNSFEPDVLPTPGPIEAAVW